MSSLDEKLLAEATAAGGPSTWGEARRFGVIVTGLFACFLNTGLIFGFAAIEPALITHGAFHDLCSATDSETRGACTKQSLALAALFTLASSALNLATWPMGAVLDYLGPRAMATCCSCCVALGSVLFSMGGTGVWRYAYYVGFMLMGIFGPPVFLSTVSFANLFPERAGLIMAGLVGLFDASSSVFIFLAQFIADGVSFENTFRCYAALPLISAACALMLWPNEPIAAGTFVADKGPPDIDIGSRVNSRVSVSASMSEELRILPFKRQFASKEYWLFVWTASITMICINFFIATVNDQVLRVGAADEAHALQKAFAILLPLGGIVYIPVVGYIVDRYGLTRGWLVLWASLIVFATLNFISQRFQVPAAAYASFAFIALSRCLFYTLCAAFTGALFGFETFGQIYGLVFFLAGLANLSVQPLRVIANSYGFDETNAGLLALQITTVLLPWWVFRHHLLKTRSVKRSRTIEQSVLGTVGMRAARSSVKHPSCGEVEGACS